MSCGESSEGKEVEAQSLGYIEVSRSFGEQIGLNRIGLGRWYRKWIIVDRRSMIVR